MKLFEFEKKEDINTLFKYRRMMLWVIGLCIFASIAMVSGCALGLAFGFHTFELILLGVCSLLSLITIVPSIFFFVWIEEIERIMRQRHINFDCPIHKKVQRWALKMMFWAILVMLLPMLIRKFL